MLSTHDFRNSIRAAVDEFVNTCCVLLSEAFQQASLDLRHQKRHQKRPQKRPQEKHIVGCKEPKPRVPKTKAGSYALLASDLSGGFTMTLPDGRQWHAKRARDLRRKARLKGIAWQEIGHGREQPPEQILGRVNRRT